MPKYIYSIETFYCNSWDHLFSESRDFCLGYLSRVKDFSPRNAYRLIRSDGKIITEIPEELDVSIGQIASYPTAEQYERAANKALDMAAKIREQNEKQKRKYPNSQ